MKVLKIVWSASQLFMVSTILFPKKPVEHARKSFTQLACTNGLHLATSPLARSAVRPFSEVFFIGSCRCRRSSQREWIGSTLKYWCEASEHDKVPSVSMILKSGNLCRLLCKSSETFFFYKRLLHIWEKIFILMA